MVELKKRAWWRNFQNFKFKTLSVREVCKRADEIQQERVTNKKKPLKALENLLCENGIERLKTNFELTNLREPMLTEEAREELLQLEIPLSPEDRGSKKSS